MICEIRIEIMLKYVVLEVTRPEKDWFSVREWGFKSFPYPVPNTWDLKKTFFITKFAIENRIAWASSLSKLRFNLEFSCHKTTKL